MRDCGQDLFSICIRDVVVPLWTFNSFVCPIPERMTMDSGISTNLRANFKSRSVADGFPFPVDSVNAAA